VPGWLFHRRRSRENDTSEFLTDFVQRVQRLFDISVSVPAAASLEHRAKLPSVLQPFYAITDGLTLPFLCISDALIVAIEMDHEVPDNVLDPSWAWFGSDLWDTQYLCRRHGTAGRGFALWEPEITIPVVPGFVTLEQLLEHELQRFRQSPERLTAQMKAWSFGAGHRSGTGAA
jgi:hypothetical protein